MEAHQKKDRKPTYLTQNPLNFSIENVQHDAQEVKYQYEVSSPKTAKGFADEPSILLSNISDLIAITHNRILQPLPRFLNLTLDWIGTYQFYLSQVPYL